MFEDDEEFALPASVAELHDLHAELWLNYFQPAEPLKKEHRRKLRERMNLVANTANQKQGFGALQKITESTHWIPDPSKPKEPAKAAGKGITGRTGVQKPVKETTAAPQSTVDGTQKGGKVAEILNLYKSGKSRKEIIEMGYNKNTVNRQIGEYEKAQKGGTNG